MAVGVKSKEFGCYWKSMFLTSLTYPDKIDKLNKKHIEKMKSYKLFYSSFKNIIPCKFCREYTRDVLEKEYPLNFSGKIALMYSIYLWKDRVNIKLINQGCKTTKPSPPFKQIYMRYMKYQAHCDKLVGKCV